MIDQPVGPTTFRVDHVGSLLRPPDLMQARRAFATGEMDRESLRKVEDEEIHRAIARQQSAGLKVVTDGDFRRSAFHIDFLNALEGVRWDDSSFQQAFVGGPSHGESPAVFRTTDRIRHRADITVDDWRHAQACAAVTAKVTMPSPTFAHYRGGRAAIDLQAYPDLDEFFADLAAAYRAEIAALAAAGCRYVQFDEVHLAFLCDPKLVSALEERGDDPERLAKTYARLINEAVGGRPPGMAFGIHLCRGNRRSSWVAEGGYDPIAELLFNMIDADVFLLEYDSERAGGFEPLRHCPRGKRIVLGLVSSKTDELEPSDALVRRIEDASRHASVDDLGIGPQCGFASSTGGNLITEATQWRKLELCSEVAQRVWGQDA